MNLCEESQELEMELKPTPVWEVMTRLNQRSAFGRVVINPPDRMTPLTAHKTGEEWYICDLCGYASLAQDKMIAHRAKHLEEEEVDDHKHSESGESDDEPECDDKVELVKHSENDIDNLMGKAIVNRRNGHFECHICHKLVKSFRSLRRHFAVHLDIRPFNCKICLATFKSSSNVNKHMQRSHNDAFKHKCPKCPCLFETENGLRKHITVFCVHQNVNPSKEVPKEKISSLPNGNGTNNDLNKPLKTSISEANKLFKKSDASLKASPNAQITKSSTKKTSVLKEKKQIQNEVFARKLIETLAKAKVRKAIKTKAARKIPKATCETCNKQFSCETSLKKHQAYHNKAKEVFQCRLCEFSFPFTKGLDMHIRSMHGSGAYTCYYCPCRFIMRTQRQMHCTMFHPEQINQDAEYNCF